MDAIARPGLCLLHASTDVEQTLFPMVPTGAAHLAMIGN